MPVPFSNSISIASGGSPPLVVDSSALCVNLNADQLDGREAVSFADAEHYHNAQYVNSGTLVQERLGTGVVSGGKVLFGRNAPGSNAGWRAITLVDIAEITEFVRGTLISEDAKDFRDTIGAAASVHTHTAPEVTEGVFDVDRLGSGGDASAPKVLFGSSVEGGSGQWRTPAYTDVTGAAGVYASTVKKIPYWISSGRLADSPFTCVGSPVSSVTTEADFGTNGTVTCTDLIVNYAAASQFKANVYTKIASTVLGSASVVATPASGPQTVTVGLSGDSASPGNSKLYGTNASGVKGWYDQPTGSGSSPPTTPANAVKVWVVNSGGTGGGWYDLIGSV